MQVRSPRRIALLAFACALAAPTQAFALSLDEAKIVPDWLSIIAGAVGLGIAVLLLVDAVLLRRVAEGSIVADNIAYMMSGTVCFAASMLARWVALFADDPNVAVQMGWAADLLVTAGMAFLAVYFMRVRLAMTRYLKSVASAYPGVEDSDESATDPQGENTGA